MSTLLRLRADADFPAHATQCEWALYDLRGNLLERGHSDPQHWPQAENCELVLSADQCLVLDAQLPKGARRDDAKLIGYAVEDHLIGDIQNEHVVAGETDTDGRTHVWVISRTRLSALLGALLQLGRTPRRAFSELQLAPFEAGCWSVCMRGAKGFVRLGADTGFAFDVSGSGPPAEVALAVQTARAAGTIPQRIDLYCEQEASFNADAWQSALGLPVQRAGDYAWDTYPARSVCNLLVGEFTPPRGRHSGWAPFKPALTLGAAALVLYAVFSFGEWTWMAHSANRLRQQTTDVFRTAFPQVQTIVDPVLQMQRLYDPLMRERGRLGESDFLPLLTAVSEALGSQATYHSLGYDEGRLEFTVTLKDTRAPERLREALSRRGLALTLRDSKKTPAGIETSFSVRFRT